MTRRFAHRMTMAFAIGVLLTLLVGIAAILGASALQEPDASTDRRALVANAERLRASAERLTSLAFAAREAPIDVSRAELEAAERALGDELDRLRANVGDYDSRLLLDDVAYAVSGYERDLRSLFTANPAGRNAMLQSREALDRRLDAFVLQQQRLEERQRAQAEHRAHRHRMLIDIVAIAAIIGSTGLALLTSRKFVREFERAQSEIAARERFLAFTTSELGRPLAALDHDLDHLRPLVATTPLARNALAGADAALSRLHSLLAELSEAMQLSTGNLRLRREPTDLVALVRRVETGIARAHAAVPVDLEARGRVVGEWDGAKLEEVVTHLLSNAVKFGHGRRIRVRVGTVDGAARIVVQDHGVGISRDRQQRLFEPFGTESHARGGLGLGLYIVRRIVNAHGGRVRVESEPGVGSTFTVDLPMKPPTIARERFLRMPFLRPEQQPGA